MFSTLGGKKILAGVCFSSFTVLWSGNTVPGGSLLPFGDVYAYWEWQLMHHVSERTTVMFPLALSAHTLDLHPTW